MNNQHFSQDDFKKFETPIQKLMHLNLKALKSFSDLNAEDFFNSKQANNVWKRNLDIFLKNSQKGLIYLQGVFALMEEHLSAAGAEAAKKIENKTAGKSMKSASVANKKMAQTSAVKKASPKKKAVTAKNKTIPVKTASTSKKAVKTPVKSSLSKTAKTAPKSIPVQASVKKPEIKNSSSLHNPAHFKPSTGHQGMKPGF